MNKPWENFSIDDKIKLVDIFPEKTEAIWKSLILWNIPENTFYQEKDVKTWITLIIKEAIHKKFIKRLYEYFWSEVIIDSLDFYVKKWEIQKSTLDKTKIILEELKIEENV